jgi:hypothetical protein
MALTSIMVANMASTDPWAKQFAVELYTNQNYLKSTNDFTGTAWFNDASGASNPTVQSKVGGGPFGNGSSDLITLPATSAAQYTGRNQHAWVVNSPKGRTFKFSIFLFGGNNTTQNNITLGIGEYAAPFRGNQVTVNVPPGWNEYSVSYFVPVDTVANDVQVYIRNNASEPAKAVYMSGAQLTEGSDLDTLVDTKYCGCKYDGVFSRQTDAIVFNGLNLGQRYSIRGGVIAPNTGIVTWTTAYSLIAGSSTSPNAVSYTGTKRGLTSGVHFELTPQNPPADVSGYEAVWTLNASTPLDTIEPYWSGQPSGTAGHFIFFASGKRETS